MIDSSKFKQKLLPLSSTLYRVAYRIVRDSDIAKDMVQETYVALWSKRDTLEELDSVESFAVKTLKNRCLDYLRSTRVHEMLSLDIENFSQEESPAMDEMETGETLSHVMMKLNQLPARQKQVLMLRSVQDMSLEEIEQLTGLSNINVRTLLSRARKRLRELCESEYNG